MESIQSKHIYSIIDNSCFSNSNQQKYKTTNYNATPQNKHNNINCDEILKCPKIYGYEQYRLAISHKYKINIVKSITNKNTYDCFDEYAQYPTIYDSDS